MLLVSLCFFWRFTNIKLSKTATKRFLLDLDNTWAWPKTISQKMGCCGRIFSIGDRFCGFPNRGNAFMKSCSNYVTVKKTGAATTNSKNRDVFWSHCKKFITIFYSKYLFIFEQTLVQSLVKHKICWAFVTDAIWKCVSTCKKGRRFCSYIEK